MSGTFLPYKLIGDVVYQCTLGFTPHSKARRMDCL